MVAAGPNVAPNKVGPRPRPLSETRPDVWPEPTAVPVELERNIGGSDVDDLGTRVRHPLVGDDVVEAPGETALSLPVAAP